MRHNQSTHSHSAATNARGTSGSGGREDVCQVSGRPTLPNHVSERHQIHTGSSVDALQWAARFSHSVDRWVSTTAPSASHPVEQISGGRCCSAPIHVLAPASSRHRRERCTGSRLANGGQRTQAVLDAQPWRLDLDLSAAQTSCTPSISGAAHRTTTIATASPSAGLRCRWIIEKAPADVPEWRTQQRPPMKRRTKTHKDTTQLSCQL
jgi:hypothetical protein